MTRYDSSFPEPPWTYAPKEVEAWLTSVASGAKLAKLEAFKDQALGTIENLEIVLDIDAKKTRIKPSNAFLQWMQDLTGRAKFELHFELPAVSELVLRALAKGNYREVVKIGVDTETLHNNVDRPKDLRGTVDLLTESSFRTARCDSILMKVVSVQNEDSSADVTIKRVVKKGEHTLGVRFHGEVREEDFRAFLTHLTGNLNATFTIDAASAA